MKRPKHFPLLIFLLILLTFTGCAGRDLSAMIGKTPSLVTDEETLSGESIITELTEMLNDEETDTLSQYRESAAEQTTAEKETTTQIESGEAEVTSRRFNTLDVPSSSSESLSDSTSSSGTVSQAVDTATAEKITSSKMRLSDIFSNDILSSAAPKKEAHGSEFFNDAVFVGDSIPWYSVNDFYYHDSEGNYGPEGDGMTANIMTAADGGKSASATIHISAQDKLRIANVPMGTTFTIVETDENDYIYVKAEKDVDGSSLETFTDPDRTVTGQIEPNAANNVRFYNKEKPGQNVKILKKDAEDSRNLAGVEFSLYTEEGFNANPKVPKKTGLTTDENGEIDLGRLEAGKYYLVETQAPPGYIPLTSPVEFTVSDTGVTATPPVTVTSSTGNPVVYTLNVTNTRGSELPMTGGEGSRKFMVAGALLMLTGLCFGCALRRRERRFSC